VSVHVLRTGLHAIAKDPDACNNSGVVGYGVYIGMSRQRFRR